MFDYMASSALAKKKIGKEALHMFFSPTRVPIGLTDEQIVIVVILYKLRKAQCAAYHDFIRKRALSNGAPEVIAELLAANKPLRLPDEFMPNKVMTDARFKKGLYKFLLQATVLV